MRVVIAGAGAVGAYIGARMARSGQDVVLFARGPHFRAMKEHGVRVRSADDDFIVRPEVVDNLEEAGVADFVFLGVKAQGLPDLAPRLRPLIGGDTAFVSTQNGIPWWYFQNYEGPLAESRIERIDPGGVISAAIEPTPLSDRSSTFPPRSKSRAWCVTSTAIRSLLASRTDLDPTAFVRSPQL
jgi:2-dehydropantoate 2-reductase